jgi:hypothetical protein
MPENEAALARKKNGINQKFTLLAIAIFEAKSSRAFIPP